MYILIYLYLSTIWSTYVIFFFIKLMCIIYFVFIYFFHSMSIMTSFFFKNVLLHIQIFAFLSVDSWTLRVDFPFKILHNSIFSSSYTHATYNIIYQTNKIKEDVIKKRRTSLLFAREWAKIKDIEKYLKSKYLTQTKKSYSTNFKHKNTSYMFNPNFKKKVVQH